MIPPSSIPFLARSNNSTRLAAECLDLLLELSLPDANRYRFDRLAAGRWAPQAHRSLYRAIWAEAARQAGARRREIGDDLTILERDGAQTIVWLHHVQLDDPVTLKVALDKSRVHGLLERAGVPVPLYREFRLESSQAALALLRTYEPPFVIKPAAGTSGGSGVTCAVHSVDDFHRATLHASRHSARLMIERTIAGDEYRFLILDGRLLDVVRRRAPQVVGDGTSSIAKLISKENSSRAAAAGELGTSFLRIDLDCVLTLDRAGLSLRRILPPGAVVQVRSTANNNAAGDNVTVSRDAVCDELVNDAVLAASAVQLRLAGVDLKTPDITRSLAQVGGAVIEVNGTPGLHYHYLVADPAQATKVAIPLLDTLLRIKRPLGHFC